MKSRIKAQGGAVQGRDYGQNTYHNRNVEQKLRSFHSALNNSYQSEIITLDEKTETERQWKCLINPSRLTEQFDKKVISIDFDSGMTEGTVFYWDRTGKHWIVDLQQQTEEAYFRGIITQCDYEIELDGTHYWVYLRGPVETDLSWSSKHGLYYNKMNYSLRMDITKNQQTIEYFSRFNFVKVYYSYIGDDGIEYRDEHKWQVAATDKYSSDGIIQVYLTEYADNSMEDAMIPDKEKEFEPEELHIDGPQFIKPYDTKIEYKLSEDNLQGKFVVNSNKVKIESSDNQSVVISILTGKSTEFDIVYQQDGKDDIILPVKVKSL